MIGFNTRFPVSLTKEEVEAILSCLRRGLFGRREVLLTGLIEHLERRLLAREKELKELEELMAQPDYEVGI
jgi:hypothetical protein